jgi:surface carbohydrate biosynthesis protein (TIGR04326 family)
MHLIFQRASLKSTNNKLIGGYKNTLSIKFEESNIDNNSINLSDYIEDHADEIRRVYLSWVKLNKKFNYKGKSIEKWLNIRRDFSFWYMTPLNEKCNYVKSQNINQFIKIYAITKIAGEFKPTHIICYNCNKDFYQIIEDWAIKKSIQFSTIECKKDKKQRDKYFTFRSIYNVLPIHIKSIAWIVSVYLKSRIFKKNTLQQLRNSFEEKILIVNYLFNNKNKKDFESEQWFGLNVILKEIKKQVYWIHIHTKAGAYKKEKDAESLILEWNKSSNEQSSHIALESIIDLKIIVKTIYDWLKLNYISFKIKNYTGPLVGDSLNIWPLFQKEWQETLRGVSAMNNLLHLNIFERLFQDKKYLQSTLFPMENQGWERALVYAARKYSKSSLIGSINSTVRFWDLRYYFEDNYFSDGVSKIFMPDKIAINSLDAHNKLVLGGVPDSLIAQVEALRYLYLLNIDYKTKEKDIDLVKIIILGDYLKTETKIQIQILNGIKQSYKNKIELIIKSHPNYKIDLDSFYGFKKITNCESIELGLMQSNIAFVSNNTSSVVEASVLGIPTISMKYSSGINMSPMRESKDIYFIDHNLEFESSFDDIVAKNFFIEKNLNFLNLDLALNKWKDLLVKL